MLLIIIIIFNEYTAEESEQKNIKKEKIQKRGKRRGCEMREENGVVISDEDVLQFGHASINTAETDEHRLTLLYHYDVIQCCAVFQINVFELHIENTLTCSVFCI